MGAFCSLRAPENWITATGIRITRIQKESPFEKRPQLNGFFGEVGGIGPFRVTASWRCMAGVENSQRDPTHTRRGTRAGRRTRGTSADTSGASKCACPGVRKFPASVDFAPLEDP